MVEEGQSQNRFRAQGAAEERRKNQKPQHAIPV
jgi:hypothetical protein